jgi:hypothetical protein
MTVSQRRPLHSPPDRLVRAGYVAMWLVWSLAAIGLVYVVSAWIRTAAHAALSPAHRSLFVEPGSWADLYPVHLGDPALFASLYGLGWWVWAVYLSGMFAGIAVAAVVCRPLQPPEPPQSVA